MTTIYRRELCNLKNEDEARILVEIFGKSAIIVGPPEPNIIKVRDDTAEGRKKILELMDQGYKVVSINPINP